MVSINVSQCEPQSFGLESCIIIEGLALDSMALLLLSLCNNGGVSARHFCKKTTSVYIDTGPFGRPQISRLETRHRGMKRWDGHGTGLRTFRPRRCCYTDPRGLQPHLGNIRACKPHRTLAGQLVFYTFPRATLLGVSWRCHITNMKGGERLEVQPPGTRARRDNIFLTWERSDQSEPARRILLVRE